jgi:pimeloyl-ACP methyl ester carboxylesterase
VTLNTHIEDIVNVIRFNELDHVVLVGHSYGGMAVTGAADRISDRIDALIYLDALVPSDGQAAIDLPMGSDLIEEIDSAHESGQDSVPFFVPVPLPPEVRWRFAPQPIGSFIEPIRLTGEFEAIPLKTYVLATGPGPDFTAIASELESRSGWRIVEIDAGHNMMIDVPMETAALLEQFAR